MCLFLCIIHKSVWCVGGTLVMHPHSKQTCRKGYCYDAISFKYMFIQTNLLLKKL